MSLTCKPGIQPILYLRSVLATCFYQRGAASHSQHSFNEAMYSAIAGTHVRMSLFPSCLDVPGLMVLVLASVIMIQVKHTGSKGLRLNIAFYSR